MPIEYSVRATCDKCGAEIRPLFRDRSKYAIEVKVRCWRREWTAEGVMEGLRNLAGRAKLYCAKCAG